MALGRADRNKWARVCDSEARAAERAGNTEQAAGHRKEAASWRGSGPVKDYVERPYKSYAIKEMEQSGAVAKRED